MFVSEFAVFVSRSCVLLGFFVLTERVMMLGLMMVVGGGVVVSGRQLMMLTRRMLRCLYHALPPFLRLNRHSLAEPRFHALK